MSLRERSKQSHRLLLLILIILLGCGFLITSMVSYQVSLNSVRSSLVETELPLTSDNVYSEIQKDLVRPILISSMMSNDIFLRDWVMQGEQNTDQITRYLQAVQQHYGTLTSFFVSDRTLTYYETKGVFKQMQRSDPLDAWYFRIRNMEAPYELNVDIDLANQNRLTIFINYKVFDYDGKFLGVTGVGLSVDSVIELIDEYQRRYDRSVYFVNSKGFIVLAGTNPDLINAQVGQSLSNITGLKGLQEEAGLPRNGKFEYLSHGQNHYLNVRYMPELNWYLFVDKHKNNLLPNLRKTLYLNLLISLLVTSVVLLLVWHLIRRYQHSIAALATTDSLTSLPNRRGFELLAGQALQEARRDHRPLVALMLDLDHFKQLNDTYGHQAGDLVLRGFAQNLRDGLRQSDIVCRWGGEEFIVLLKNTDHTTAFNLAEKIRGEVASQRHAYKGVDLQVTTSIGLAEIHQDDSLESLIDRADRVLYRAKQSGRNMVCMETMGNSDSF